MNKIFRVIWNASKGVWQAIGEVGASKGKTKSRSGAAVSLSSIPAIAGSLLLISPIALAGVLPTEGSVQSGNADLQVSGNTLNVIQSSQKVVIDWQFFSIGEDSKVIFSQPSSQAAALNRVTGSQVSEIRGSLTSNGQVFLINPNGILFSASAEVNVGALVASTLDISNDDFISGNYSLEGAGTGAVINRGNLRAAQGGFIAMIAASVVNTGSINADQGMIAMAAGKRVVLDMGGPVKVSVEEGVIDAYVEQGGAIRADGGVILLTAQAAGELAASAINHTGISEAQSLVTGENGRIILAGDGQVTVAGTLDVHSDTQQGGQIQVTGNTVDVLSGALLDASGHQDGGQVLIGGGYQGKDATLRNAKTTTVADNVVIKADATSTGEGGEVIVWADGRTDYQGHISAKGGALGGDGGFAEVSGKNTLAFRGTVDLTAKQGETGTLLLDPTNLTITSANNNVSGGPSFIPTAGGASTLDSSTLITALASANVIVTTNGSPDTGAEVGLITVETNLTYDSPYKLTLTTAANGGVAVNTGTNFTNNGFGGFEINAGTAGINLNNSALTFKGGPVTLNSNASIAGTGSITTTTGANTGISSGKVTFVAADSINYTGVITTSGASNANGQGSSAGEVIMTVGATGSALTHTITTGSINTIGGMGTDGIGGGGGSIRLTTLGTNTSNHITIGALNATGGASNKNLFTDAYNGGNAGNLLVDAGESTIYLKGDIALEGGAPTATSGFAPQGLGGNARFKTDVLLKENIVIGTGNTNGNVTFEKTVNSEISNDKKNLTIEVGEGAVVFNDTVGAGNSEAQELGALTVSAWTITAKQNITARDGVNFDATSGIVLGDTATPGQTLTINANRTDNTSAVGNGSVIMDAGLSSTQLYADLVVTRGTGAVTFISSLGNAVTGTLHTGDTANYDITINGSGAVDATTGHVSFSASNSGYSLFNIGDIALSQIGDLSITGSIKAKSLVYADKGTGNVSLARNVSLAGNVFSGSAAATYDVDKDGTSESHIAGLFIDTAGSIAVSIDNSLTSSGAEASLIANGVSNFSGTNRSLYFSSDLYSDLTTTNGLIYLKGEGVYQVSGANIADIDSGSQRIIIDGGGKEIYLGGRLNTTHNDTGGPAVLLRNANNVSITGVSNSKKGTLQIGTAKSGGSSADVTGNVIQRYHSGNGIIVKTISAYTGGDITITSTQNDFDHTGTIELGGKLNVQSNLGGLSLLGDIMATQVRLATGGSALALGDFDVKTVTGTGDGDGTVILIGRGVTQGAGSVVDAGASTLAVDGKDVGTGNTGNIDLAGELKTTNNTASAVRVYHSAETNSTIKVGQITATSGQVTIGTSSTTLSGGSTSSTSSTVSQYTDDTDVTNIIYADALLVQSRGAITLNNDNKLNKLLGVRYNGDVDIKDMDGLLLLGGIQNYVSGFFSVKLESAATGGTGAALLDINGQNITANGITLLGQGTGSNGTLTGGVVSNGGTLEAKNGAILVDAGDGRIDFAGTNISTDNIGTDAVSMLNTGVGGDVVLGDITAENSAGNVGGLILGSTTDAKQIGGDVSQEAGSVLRVGRITGQVTGNVDLTENNIVRYNNTTAGTLADFSVGGSFSFKNIDASNLNRGLSITGAITAGGAVDIESNGGALNLTGSIDGIGVSLKSNLAAGEIILAGNVDANAGDVSLIANGRNVTSLKSISQTDGIITSLGTLSGSSQSQVDLIKANNIAQLGPFAANALSFELNNLGRGNNALTLVGDIGAATDITITTSDLLDLSTFNVSSSTGLIKLTGVGVSQSAGSSVSSTSGNSSAVNNADRGGVHIDGGAAAVTLAGSVSTGNSGLAASNINAILVQNASTVQLGTVSAASGRFTIGLNDVGKRITGETTQATGTSVSALELDIYSSGSVALSNASNTITTLNHANTAGGLSLNDSTGGLILAGNILEAGDGNVNVTTKGSSLAVGTNNITATGTGSINLTGKAISTSLTSSINAGSGTITLDGDSAGVTLDGDVTTTHNSTGSMTIKDATAVSLSNVTTGVGGSLTLGVAADSAGVGAVTQVSGTKVVTGKVDGFAQRSSSRASVDLANVNNEFTQLGNLTTSSLKLYSKNSGGLTWVGDVDAAGTTDITSLGAINLDTYNLLATGSTLNITGVGISQSAETRSGAANPSTIQSASANIQAGSGSINLLSTNNDFTSTVQLSSSGTEAAVRDRNALITSSILRRGSIGLASATGITAIAGTTLSLAQEAIVKTGMGKVDLRALGGNFQTSDSIQTQSGSISITQASSNTEHGISVNHALTSTSGDISLSGRSVAHSGGGDLMTGGVGGIGVLASTGNISMVNGTEYTAGTGGIALTAQNNIGLAALTTTGDASLVSTSGSIRDVSNASDINITANLITLSASTGVGQSASSNQEINLSANTLVLSSNTVGIFVTNDKNVSLGNSSAASGLGEVNILTSGNLSVKANGSITTDKTITAAGNSTVHLETLGTSQNIIIKSNVSMAGGLLSLTTVDGNIDQTAGAITTAGITVDAGGDVTLAQANNDFTDDVDVTASGNVSLTDVNSIDLGRIDLTAGTLTVTAVGISQSDEITQAENAGDVSFNAGAATITLNNANNEFTGAVSLNNSGAYAVSIKDKTAIDLGSSSVGSNSLTVNAVGITQSGEIVQSAVSIASFNGGAAAIELTNADNEFTSVSAYSSADGVSISEKDGFAVHTINAGSANALNLQSGGDISMFTGAGLITAGAFSAKTLNDAGASITLTNANSDVASVDLQARNAADTVNSIGNINYVDNTGFEVAGLATGGTAVLTANLSVTQTGAAQIDKLALKGTGSFVLDNASNEIAHLASETTGDVNIVSSTATTIDTVNPIGVNTGNADFALTAASIHLAQGIAAGTGDVYLETTNSATGTITQGAGEGITSAGLAIKAVGDVNLADSTNNVSKFAADLAIDKTLTYRDIDGISIANLTDIAVSGNSVSGLQVLGGASAVSLNLGGLLTQEMTDALIQLDGDLTIDTTRNTNAGDVSIKNTVAGGTELDSSIIAGDFILSSNGNVTQTEVSGVTNDAFLQVGEQLTISGGSFIAGDSTENLLGGGLVSGARLGSEIRLNGVITLSMDDGKLVGVIGDGVGANRQEIAAADLTSVKVVSLAGGKNITFAGSDNVAVTLGSVNNTIAGKIKITTAGAYTNTGGSTNTGIKQSNALDLKNASFEVQASALNTSPSMDTGIGVINLLTSNNIFDGTVTARAFGMDITITDNSNMTLETVNGRNVVLNAGAASHTITQTGAVVATNLLIQNAGGVTLNNVNNSVGTFAADVSGAFNLTSDAMTVGTIGTVEGLSAGGDITLTADSLVVTEAVALKDGVSGALVLKPLAAATTIGLGDGVGAFSIDADEWSLITDGFSGITVGRTDGAGKITVGALTASDELTLQNTTGGIELTGALNTGVNDLVLNTTGTITQSAAITADGLGILNASAVDLSNTANNVTTLAASSITGDFTYADADALTIGRVNPTGITSTGTVDISTQTGDLTVSENVSGSSVVLNAGKATAAGTATGGNVIIDSGKTVSASTGGNAVIYTGSLTDSAGVAALVGFGTGNFRYNGIESTTYMGAGAIGATGVFAVYREQPTLQVTPNAASSQYGDTPVLTGLSASYDGFKNGDVNAQVGVTGVYTTEATNASDVGRYNIAYSGGLLSAIGYAFTDKTASVSEYSVIPRVISLSGTREYDQGVTADASVLITFNNVMSGEALTLTGSGTVADKNVANNKTVTAGTLVLGDGVNGLASNYTLATGMHQLSITSKTITISGITAADKVYDATTNAVVDVSNAAGWISGDDVKVATSTSGVFTTKQVASDKVVTLTSVYDGTDVGNYTITDQASTIATISKKELTVSGVVAVDKVYDGTTTAGINTSSAILNGTLTGDIVAISTMTGTFEDKNVALNKVVNGSGATLTGADADNYALTQPTGLQADISKRVLSVSLATDGIADKVYDGTTNARVTLEDDRVSGDEVIFTYDAAFIDKNAGTKKYVTVSNIEIGSGADAGNYTMNLSAPEPGYAAIMKKTISIGGITAENKTYDSNRDAVVDATNAQGWLDGDDFTITATGLFDSKFAGQNKQVILSSTYGGADKDNYTIINQALTMANINPDETVNRAVIEVFNNTPVVTYELPDIAIGEMDYKEAKIEEIDSITSVNQEANYTGILRVFILDGGILTTDADEPLDINNSL